MRFVWHVNSRYHSSKNTVILLICNIKIVSKPLRTGLRVLEVTLFRTFQISSLCKICTQQSHRMCSKTLIK